MEITLASYAWQTPPRVALVKLPEPKKISYTFSHQMVFDKPLLQFPTKFGKLSGEIAFEYF